MLFTAETHGLIIVGAGPAGLACAYHARAAGLDAVVLERGCVADNIRRYPASLTFYSTPTRLELGDIPLLCTGEKPTRSEVVRYYTRFADARGLDVRTYHNVTGIARDGGDFVLATESPVGLRREFRAPKLVLAFGAYDEPNRLGVPGEDLPHVSHFYDEPERYHRCDVLVVGGKGSASEAALQIERFGGRVTISYRRPEFAGLKYWIAPDLANRIAEGSIRAVMPSRVESIGLQTALLRRSDTRETVEVKADFVLALTGYAPRLDLFDAVGLDYDAESLRPRLVPETLESSVPGCYVAGCICAGNIGNEIFIENGRLHGAAIVAHIAGLATAGR
ncbi:MAG: YpdA family putative bacillithiol disulfide reductase [Armatimonadetes bacterium]|nr:YpdA family putative bacillithiol disulfide reductase [Armatimonadota bacterium]